MSTQHSDGVGEIVDDMLRQALMVAARLGEIAARARQEHLAQARVESERQARELAARFEAERGAARSSLAGVGSDSWWAQAEPERVAAAYKTAASWAGEDAEMAETLRQMDEQLAARNVHVTPSMPERVDDLLCSRAWVAEHDPFMDEAWTREMAQARSTDERDRLNVALVSAWLARPEAQEASDAANELEEAKAWAKETHPDWFNQWDAARAHADSVESTMADERELIRRWKTETGGLTQRNPPTAAKAASTEANNSAEDLARTPREQGQFLAHHGWDTARRRKEFAASLQGKADQIAVDARLLADVSQGTHPQQAVSEAPRNAPMARLDNSSARRPRLTKGSR